MRNVVVGTAGHVDHGKTALVKRLTGVNTDTLREERVRGMSIEMAVASRRLSSGRVIDFIDVPGHERFIRNMLCGVSGVDAAMFVVAADDGPMPQTEEHLDILTLLGVSAGFVALSKIDAVDEELLAMALDETKIAIAGTALGGCPIVCVSAKTGEGIGETERLLEDMCSDVRPRSDDQAFRLPVDRVMSVPGAGTVVTGTITAGAIEVGETVQLYPHAKTARVRTLQSRGSEVARAHAGDRVGVNLHAIDAASVSRGITLAQPESLTPTHLLNVRLTYLARNTRPLASGQRARVYAGTSETIGRLMLMERAVLLPGESGLAQLRLEEKIAPAPDDAFIVRGLSPLATIGGGVVLEAATRKYRRAHPSANATLDLLKAMDAGDGDEAASKVVADSGLEGCRTPDVSQRLALTEAAACRLLQQLVRKTLVVEPAPGVFVSAAVFSKLKRDICDAVSRRHAADPLQLSFETEHTRSRLARSLPKNAWTRALAELADEGRLELTGSRFATPGYVPVLSPRQLDTIARIRQAFAESPFRPVWPSDICAAIAERPPKQVKTLIAYMVSHGELTRLATGAVIPSERMTEAKELLRQNIRQRGGITLPEARDLLGIGRHPAQWILEHFDAAGVTERRGNVRVLVPVDPQATQAVRSRVRERSRAS